VPADKSNAVAGLVNFMRTMGCSVGTSLVTTLVDRRSQFHQAHLVSRFAPDNPSFVVQFADTVRRLAAAGLSTWDAQGRALAGFYKMVQAQAAALAYIDTFWFLAIGAVLMFALVFALERNDPHAGGAVHLH
jgi:DHA2 family multidrug resistance protein